MKLVKKLSLQHNFTRSFREVRIFFQKNYEAVILMWLVGIAVYSLATIFLVLMK